MVAGVQVSCGGTSGAHREEPKAGLQAVHERSAAAQAHCRRLVVGHQRLDHWAQRAHTCTVACSCGSLAEPLLRPTKGVLGRENPVSTLRRLHTSSRLTVRQAYSSWALCKWTTCASVNKARLWACAAGAHQTGCCAPPQAHRRCISPAQPRAPCQRPLQHAAMSVAPMPRRSWHGTGPEGAVAASVYAEVCPSAARSSGIATSQVRHALQAGRAQCHWSASKQPSLQQAAR